MTTKTNGVRTLVLDIESRPAEAFVWGLWDVNVGINQVKENHDVLCWSAKWVGEDYIYFSSVFHHGKENMVEALWEMMDEADEVVGFNSRQFDIKHMNAQFFMQGLPPPSPYKSIDLLRTIKGTMRFLSNKLDFISKTLDIGQKTEHEGFPLWVACMEGDKKAWQLMQTYNEQDVLLTEELYHKLIPWITTGINRSALTDDHVCPNCSSHKLQKRGLTRNLQLTYQRWQCQECGTWSRSVVAENKADRAKRLVIAR